MASDKNENIFPQISADVSEAEQQMDLKDKLALIDKEVRQLYQFCVQEGFTPGQIQKCAEPLLAVEKTQKRKKWLKRLAWLVAIVAIVAGVFMYSPVYNKVCIYAKLASMKVLPYWDWRYIYDEECAISNPYRVEDTMTKEECVEKCKNLKRVKSLTNINHKVMSEYLLNQTPVVIKDATQDWRARKEFSIEFLSELFQQSSMLRTTVACHFQSSHPEFEHPSSLLKEVVEGGIKDFQTYWENCDLGAAKEFRQFYKRPYFLPPMVEAVEGNWMLVSSGGTKSLRVTWSASISWLAQITGKSRIILRPDPTCEDTCQPLTVFLEPGDSILFSNEMWSTSIKPYGDEPVIAIGAGGSTF